MEQFNKDKNHRMNEGNIARDLKKIKLCHFQILNGTGFSVN